MQSADAMLDRRRCLLSPLCVNKNLDAIIINKIIIFIFRKVEENNVPLRKFIFYKVLI